jgi:hypothetical protein
VCHIGSVVAICHKTFNDYGTDTISTEHSLLYGVLCVLMITAGNSQLTKGSSTRTSSNPRKWEPRKLCGLGTTTSNWQSLFICIFRLRGGWWMTPHWRLWGCIGWWAFCWFRHIWDFIARRTLNRMLFDGGLMEWLFEACELWSINLIVELLRIRH